MYIAAENARSNNAGLVLKLSAQFAKQDPLPLDLANGPLVHNQRGNSRLFSGREICCAKKMKAAGHFAPHSDLLAAIEQSTADS